MLRECIEKCTDELWLHGEHPRLFWRIVYHASAYAHLYLYPELGSFQAWSKHRLECTYLEGETPINTPYSQAELLEYVDLIISEVDSQIDSLNLESASCGFTWYPNIGRFELQILSLRHLHGHIGQLSEILLANGIDTEWKGEWSAES
jgi:hypothetical protein